MAKLGPAQPFGKTATNPLPDRKQFARRPRTPRIYVSNPDFLLPTASSPSSSSAWSQRSFMSVARRIASISGVSGGSTGSARRSAVTSDGDQRQHQVPVPDCGLESAMDALKHDPCSAAAIGAMAKKAGSPSRAGENDGNHGLGLDQPPVAANGNLRRPGDGLSNLSSSKAEDRQGAEQAQGHRRDRDGN